MCILILRRVISRSIFGRRNSDFLLLFFLALRESDREGRELLWRRKSIVYRSMVVDGCIYQSTARLV